ncbi:MAG: HlyC/CorC family transporter [Candidatus Latescibacteria bacterium]|nr:HlyC/CorC family transporter [Candidatus Latescibacterota bacterium]
MHHSLLIVMAFGLVVMNGFFVAAEFAIVKIRTTRLDTHALRQSRRVKMARHVLDHLDTYLSATQFGITLASLGLGWIGEPAFASLLEPVLRTFGPWSSLVSHSIALTMAFCLITFLHIVVGELAPKSLAIRKAEPTTLWVVGPLIVFYKVFFPAIWFLNTTANILLRLIGIQPAGGEEDVHSTEEVRLILAESHKSGVISQDEKVLVENVFDLAERTARQIMVPRADLIFLSTTYPMDRNLQIAHQFRYTRFPLCDGDLDHVIGMIHIKELFVLVRDGLRVNDLQTIKREILFMPETASVKSLLKEFQRRHLQMAIIIDEYGGTAGLVTMEDVLEEIVGDIQGELDRPVPPKFQREANGSCLVQATTLLDEVNRELGIEIEDEENETIGGHVITRLGRMARPGDTVIIGPYEVQVKEIQGRRVNRLLFIPRHDNSQQDDGA